MWNSFHIPFVQVLWLVMMSLPALLLCSASLVTVGRSFNGFSPDFSKLPVTYDVQKPTQKRADSLQCLLQKTLHSEMHMVTATLCNLRTHTLEIHPRLENSIAAWKINPYQKCMRIAQKKQTVKHSRIRSRT